MLIILLKDTFGRNDLLEKIETLRLKWVNNEKQVIARILEDEYTGQGIRRTNSYETMLTKEELEKARENFWSNCESESESIAAWKMLRLICESEYGIISHKIIKIATALNILKDCGIVLYQNNIQISFGPTGEIMYLPLYVINFPKRYSKNIQQNPDISTKSDSEQENNKIPEEIYTVFYHIG